MGPRGGNTPQICAVVSHGTWFQFLTIGRPLWGSPNSCKGTVLFLCESILVCSLSRPGRQRALC